ncbi:50S ribosomal protein L10 [bacterium]|nr:MAG: 50S ribosomal protein L10 [bacterium]
MARPEKVAEVQAIAERIAGAQSMVLADFSGLTVEQMTIFRRNCRAKSVECRVVKNRLAILAADNNNMEGMKDYLTGPTAILFGAESQVDPAKITVEFAKDNEAMEIKGGFVDGAFLDTTQVVALSKIPSHEELLAKMMGSLNSPATGLVGTINGVAAALARVIDAAAKQKAEAA